MASGSASAHTASENSDLLLVSVRPLWRAALVAVLVIIALAGAWKAAWWFLGNDVARHAFDREGAEAAVAWAPSDPQAHYMQAVITERRAKGFDAVANARAALPFYESAVSLAPNDYRFWMELGRARERAGEIEAALPALRRSVELAPAYALPRWQFGNLLLRAGQIDAAFSELQRAGEANESFRQQVVNLAWRYSKGDVLQVMRLLGDSAAVQSELITYLTGQKRLNEALQVWTNIDADTSAETKSRVAVNLERTLFDARRFRDALRVNQVRASLAAVQPASSRAGFGQIANDGFEAGVPPANRELFGWQLARTPGAEVELDATTRYSGARALRIAFAAPTGIELRALRQTIVVEPGGRYRLSFYVRGEELQSASLPLIEVVDASAEVRFLGASSPMAIGTSDWTRGVVEFTVPADTDGVTLRFARPACPDATCPIFGRAWYDEFNLEKLGGARVN